MTNYYEMFKQHEESIVENIITTLQTQIPTYSKISRDDVRKRVIAGLDPYARDLDTEHPKAFPDYWRETSYLRAQQGIPIGDFLQVLLLSTDIMIQGLRQTYPDSTVDQINVIEKGHQITTAAIAGVYEGFQQHKDEIISSQTYALAEVSSPIVPVYEGVLVLPLIGSIDSMRAGQIMESLLESINSYSADVVILDITGVPVIDTGVANYLLQSARAARLLGSTVVLVGIGAEIAQTIVQLGIDLTGIVTRANLQSGIEYALDLQGLAIRPR